VVAIHEVLLLMTVRCPGCAAQGRLAEANEASAARQFVTVALMPAIPRLPREADVERRFDQEIGPVPVRSGWSCAVIDILRLTAMNEVVDLA